MIRLVSPDGNVSALITNLPRTSEFITEEIIALYFKRWEIESYYRDEKEIMEIERFHAKTCNGIKHEMYATLIMSIISRLLMVIPTQKTEPQEVQFKNAIRSLAYDAAILAPDNPEKAIEIFEDLLERIRRVKYYRPKKRRSSQPRVTKKTVKKWSVLKKQKLAKA